jgi:MHS family alpha-ketoglutarate permease-like MFS transporter
MSSSNSGAAQVGGPSDTAKGSMASTIAGGAIGNLIEWYDWTIYGLLAPVFSQQFFPSNDDTWSLIQTLFPFALGFLMRPLGALVLSPMADKYGRRQMLSLTIILMGIGSLIVAVTPSYASIGVWAPIALIFARLLQGFSAGGEFQGSTAFLAEHAPAERRAYVSSAQLVSIALSILIATGVARLTTGVIAQPALGDWGWRVPFLVGALLSIYGIYLRLRLPETPAFVKIEHQGALSSAPILDSIRQYPLSFLRVFVIQMSTVQFYIWTVFLASYAYQTGKLPLADGFLGSMIALTVFCVALPAAGALSDRIGRKPLLLGTAIGFFLLSYPMFTLLRKGDFTTFLIVDIIGILLLAGVDGVMSAVFCELFPTRLRTTGIGVPYAICAAIFSGTAPLIAAKYPEFVAFYVMAIAFISIVTFIFMPETRGKPLQ